MKENLVVVHGGGPTAVLNTSLYGVMKEAYNNPRTGCLYAACGGTGGLLYDRFQDLSEVPPRKRKLLLTTPGSAIGTSRERLEEEDYIRMIEVLKRKRISCVLFNGGNGTMDTCSRFQHFCKREQADIRVIGIPKTIDNDLSGTDHSPGFGSAARYLAASVQEVCCDVKSLPIHVVIIEAFGRNAGWLAASSALARKRKGDGPDLIYLPEIPFDEEKFLTDAERFIKQKNGVVVVASEGLRDLKGNLVVQPAFQVGRATYFGDVSTHLANLIIKNTGYKARGEKPGLFGRASIALRSGLDVAEAGLVGEEACRAILSGESGKMVALQRLPGSKYQAKTCLVEIDEGLLTENCMPKSFLGAGGRDVSAAFIDWCKPLLGGELPEMADFQAGAYS